MKIISIFTCGIFISIAGCGNKFEECIQNQQEDYRRLHPEASYSGGNAQGYSNIGQYPTTRTFGASINLTF